MPRSAAGAVAPGDALVRAMCHDMRSPLAALESVLDRLEGEDRELLELARAQAQHLSSMLRTANATGGTPQRRGAPPQGDHNPPPVPPPEPPAPAAPPL